MPTGTRGQPSGGSPAYGSGREALLRATVTVVARGGLRALTYRAVAEQAGVTHALVRFHFGSRDALIVAATEYSLAEAIRVGGLQSTSHGVDDYADQLADLLVTEADLTAFQFDVILETRRRPELRPVVRELYEAFWKTATADLVHRGVPADESLGRLVFAALDGLVLYSLSMDDPTALDAPRRRLRQLLALAASHPEAFSDEPTNTATAGPARA